MTRQDKTSIAARKAPDFFIVGHPKCGTTALYEMLKSQPKIFMPKLKEPQFFATEMRDESRPSHLPDTLDEYLALFDPARPGQLLGEASPSYLRSHTAAARIAQLQPDARIIAILREPASFLRSVHLQFVQAGIETEHDLRKALALEQDRRLGKSLPRNAYWPQVLMYSDHVRYVEQLRRYRAVFPQENVLVLVYDDFRADNEATVSRVLRFLGVNEGDRAPIVQVEANPTVGTRSRRLHELMNALAVGRGPASRPVNAAVRALTPEGPRRRALGVIRRRVVFGEPPAPDERLMGELRHQLQPEVQALSEFLDRDLLAFWGYDRV